MEAVTSDCGDGLNETPLGLIFARRSGRARECQCRKIVKPRLTYGRGYV